MIRIGFGELRDVVGHGPGAVARDLGMATLQKPGQWRPGAHIAA
jgi:hypothetical protein